MSLSVKLGIAGLLLVALAGCLTWFARHERAIGAAAVQARWDVATAEQAAAALRASESARAVERRQSATFAGIATGYLQATAHAPTPFDLPAALAAGTLRLRNDCPAPRAAGDVPATTARARAADAAAAAAATQRLADSVAAVRAGDAADARERQLSAQVTALQAILRAERDAQPAAPIRPPSS